MSTRPPRATDVPPLAADRPGTDGATRRDILGTAEKLYSQGNEELIVRDFFRDRRGGSFLDVGAGHPVRDSTTCYLERHLGWSGICVDALAAYAPDYAQQRPASRFRNFVVGDRSDTIASFYHVKAAPGLSSTTPNRPWWDKSLNGVLVKVPTITLDDLLAREDFATVDFLSIDIELSEPAALRGLNLRRLRPALVCIESERLADVSGYFERHGYAQLRRYRRHDDVNFYFHPVA